jgi:hypothetical protein
MNHDDDDRTRTVHVPVPPVQVAHDGNRRPAAGPASTGEGSGSGPSGRTQNVFSQEDPPHSRRDEVEATVLSAVLCIVAVTILMLAIGWVFALVIGVN